MKKFLTLCLTLSILFGLCACGGSGAVEEQSGAPAGLQAGYAKEPILPKEPVGMAGFANNSFRRSTGYADIICTICVAFSDGKDTVLLFTADNIGMHEETTKKIREAISQKTGVPQDKIMLSSTHTHSGPDIVEEPYRTDVFIPACVKAAEKAIADLAPATLYGTKTAVEGISYTRHYYDNNGKYVYGNQYSGDQLSKHSHDADPEMIVIKADREGDKKDISLINWQTHPCFAYSEDTVLSGDFIATTRTQMEAQTNSLNIYFTGAAGDLVTDSKIHGRPHPNAAAYGAAVAEKAIEAYNGTMTKIEGTGIKTVQNNFEYATNRAGIERVDDAQKVVDYANQVGSYESAEPNNYAKELGFKSARECLTIVDNASKPEKKPMELNAFSVGGMAFIFAPYEMFCENGVFIKENSPFEFTFINELSNEAHGYFAVKEAYEAEDIYEVNTASFASGVAEATADQFVSMLKGLQ